MGIFGLKSFWSGMFVVYCYLLSGEGVWVDVLWVLVVVSVVKVDRLDMNWCVLGDSNR